MTLATPVAPDFDRGDDRARQHRVELVRPGPVSLTWLKQVVAEPQVGERLRPVSIVVASPYRGAIVKRALAEHGCANVRTLVLRQLAAILAGRPVEREKRELNGVLEGAAIRQALRDAADGPFAGVAHHQSLHEALGNLFRELQYQEASEALLETLAGRGSVPRAAVATFRRFAELSAGYYAPPIWRGWRQPPTMPVPVTGSTISGPWSCTCRPD